jgi:hypothetical protein
LNWRFARQAPDLSLNDKLVDLGRYSGNSPFVMILIFNIALVFGGGVAFEAIVRSYARSHQGAWIERARHWLFTMRSIYYDRRLSRRLAVGHDRYFEELRAIEAGRPTPPAAIASFSSCWKRAIKYWAIFAIVTSHRELLAALNSFYAVQ